MDTSKLIGTVYFKVRHLPSETILQTKVEFQDGLDQIYYCWTLNDISGKLIASKSLRISKRTIDRDEFEFSINHSAFSIDNYKINRQKIFKVIEATK
jgi:phage pi2 protein 07